MRRRRLGELFRRRRRWTARLFWLVDREAREGRDYELEKLLPFWKLTSEQDCDLCEGVQRGVGSRAYTPGPFSSAMSNRYVMAAGSHTMSVSMKISQSVSSSVSHSSTSLFRA